MNQHHPRVISTDSSSDYSSVIPQKPRDVRETIKEKWKRKQQTEAVLKTQASVVPFLFEDGCSLPILRRQLQNVKQHPHNNKFTLFYEQSGFDVTLDSDGWEAFLYHIRSLEDKTVILKVLTSNSSKSALTSLLNKATDSPNLKLRDIGMPSTSRNDTERDSGLKIVNQNSVVYYK